MVHNPQVAMFNNALKNQGVEVTYDKNKTCKGLILQSKDKLIGVEQVDIIVPYKISIANGETVKANDKSYFVTNQENQFGIRNVYHCYKNPHTTTWKYSDTSFDYDMLVYSAVEGSIKLATEINLKVASGFVIAYIKLDTITRNIMLNDRVGLMDRAYKVTGVTWQTNNIVKLELDEDSWLVTDDKEHCIANNERKFYKDIPSVFVDKIVGSDSFDQYNTSKYIITNPNLLMVEWSVNNANAKIVSSDNKSCTLEGVKDGDIVLTAKLSDGTILTKDITVEKVVITDIVIGASEIKIDEEESYTITNSRNFEVVWAINDTDKAIIVSHTNKSCIVMGVSDGSFTLSATYEGETFTKEIETTHEVVIEDEVVGANECEVGSTSIYTITNELADTITWSISDNTIATIVSSDNTSCIVQFVDDNDKADSTIAITATYTIKPVSFTKQVSLKAKPTYDPDVDGVLSDTWNEVENVGGGDMINYTNDKVIVVNSALPSNTYVFDESGWSKITLPYAINDIVYEKLNNNDEYKYYGKYSKSIFESTDLVNWESSNLTSPAPTIYAYGITMDKTLVAFTSGKMWFTADYIDSFIDVDFTYNGSKVSGSKFRVFENTTIIVAGNKLFINTTGQDTEVPTSYNCKELGISMNDICYSSKLNLYVITAYKKIYISKDLNTVTEVYSDTSSLNYYFNKVIYKNGIFIVTADRDNNVFVSKDGENWQMVQVTTENVILKGVCVDKNGLVYATGQMNGTTTNGKTFTCQIIT